MKKQKYSVLMVMGSRSDWATMKEGADALKTLGVSVDVQVVSAHRTPEDMATIAKNARSSGYKVIVAGAGGAAHLPGMIAAHTELPVIGVPVPSGALQGMDSLLSIVQMPKGVPVATVAIANAWNAGILAAQIVGVADSRIWDAIRQYKDKLGEQVRQSAKDLK